MKTKSRMLQLPKSELGLKREVPVRAEVGVGALLPLLHVAPSGAAAELVKRLKVWSSRPD